MRVLITGADGFIGKNLEFFLQNQELVTEIIKLNRSSSEKEFAQKLERADFIFHLAGENRPRLKSDFYNGNVEYTKKIIKFLEAKKLKPTILYVSSKKIEDGTDYGKSKKLAEEAVVKYSKNTKASYYIFRLPNVFGKWCKPNYNSFVATFCNNIALGLPITIHDNNTKVELIYIDDLCQQFLGFIGNNKKSGLVKIKHTFKTTVGEVAKIINNFHDDRKNFFVDSVGSGLKRALYATYLSYVNPLDFSYGLLVNKDERGFFSEVIKTYHSGQISVFTAHPGVTRGQHYHHTKNEKFLIVQGEALFRFKNILTNELFEIHASADELKIVETIPGWSHDITNVGENELIAFLWANEIFDPENPDTFYYELK